MKNASFCFLFCILLLYFLVFLTDFSSEPPQMYDFSKELRVYDAKSNQTFNMPMETYIMHCLAAEMPASFHTEALKAQAIAIRGYICRKIENGVSHPDNANICTDYAHCTAYLPDFDSLPEAARAKYTDAVTQTQNEVLYYKEEIANTVFHAMSGGKTESAENVWGGKVPYLISVESTLDTCAENFETTVSVSYEEVKQKLEITDVSVGEVICNKGGTVKNIQIGGKTFSGREIREKFSLRSANFSVQTKENGITFTVLGYGHGVGMSQTGADAYAKEGMNYAEILAKYYPGTTLCRLY